MNQKTKPSEHPEGVQFVPCLFILVIDRGLSLNFNYIKSNLEMEKGKFNWAAPYLNVAEECKDKMQPRDYVVLLDKLHEVDELVQEIKNR